MLIAVFQAIGKVRKLIIWKQGKADSHLVKRVRLGHLPDDATLEQYNMIITFVVNSPDANVYLYVYGETIYPTLVANVENPAMVSNDWLRWGFRNCFSSR
ncbi:hypothetical protein PL11201_80420 [Planktothrix sp. PCC 11201]|uniref:hypothetical protein n=1 Tax=Planktothrix sp. PCC 11201 TaxID=1729650 RepID=UPI0009244E1B|nr:hypothetical protein [Planktothrix sp. PCC 11201]SKB16110.1 hypothetical protein PL11201_80420 [Planktothrix sp. PCC 11201]